MTDLASWSLARRQLVLMAGGVTVLALLLGLGGAWYIARLSERALDRVLNASVTAIADTVGVERGAITLDVPPSAFAMLEGGARADVFYSVRAGGRLITGYAALPAPPPADRTEPDTSYRYGHFLGQPVRIATRVRRLPRIAEPVVVQVAETLEERHAMARYLLVRLAAVEALLVLVVALLIRPAVTWSLRPVLRLRAELAQRGRDRLEFTPIETARVPLELQGLIRGFNDLLERLHLATVGIQQFTADASHQMRTPLAVLRTNIDILDRHGSHSAIGQVALRDTAIAVNGLQRLLSQLLGLARADDRATASHDAAIVRLDDIAADVAREFAPAAIAVGTDIHFLAEAAVPARADPSITAELLGNLIDNAIRYSGPGATVIVRAATIDGAPTVIVSDDGPGIAPDQRENVFRRFHRLDRDRHRDGSGLGLPIVRKLAETMGATVVLGDGEGGRGLAITTRFPGVATASAARKADESEAA